ncbi:MAG: extracellular solute-binding protein [Bacteroidota bacterium]
MNTPAKILLAAVGLFFGTTAIYLFSTQYGFNGFTGQQSTVSKVYFADHISPAHEAVIQRFNQLHHGHIEVIPVNLPFNKFTTNERKELLARSLRSKSDRLDVFSVDYIWTERFAKWCEPLDGYFSEKDKANILSPTLQSCLSDNKLVAMPLYIDVGMMYYRKDFLKKLPDAAQIEDRLKNSVTWDELIALQKRLGMKGRPFYIFQGNDYEGLNCNYFEILASLDENYFKGNKIDLNTPIARRALHMMVDFLYKENIAPSVVTQFDENKSYEYWMKNDAMFVRGWSNFIENYRMLHNDTSSFEYIGRASLPHFAGHKVTSVYGGWNLMVSKFSNNKEAAIEFVRFLQTEEAKKIMFELGDYIPVNKDVYADTAYVKKYPKLLFYRMLIERGFHRPFLADYTKLADIVSHYVNLALKKEMTVEEALTKASSMINSNEVLIK